MDKRKEKRLVISLVEVLLILAMVGVSISLLIPGLQTIRQEAARTQTIKNLKQCGLATHNFAGTFGTRMPVNGTIVMRWGSVFGHLLPFVEQDSVYPRIPMVPNTETAPAFRVTNYSDTTTADKANAYLCQVIPSYQTPMDPTPAALNGLATNGFGTASFASNGYLFNPGSEANGESFNMVAPATQNNDSFVQNPVPNGPRLPASFLPGTAHVVMFATRYATCGANAQENYWSSPTRTYFDNTYPQTQPALGTVAPPPQVLCNPAAAQGFPAPVPGFRATGPMFCMGDASVITLYPNISTTLWNRIISPQYLDPPFLEEGRDGWMK